jgi:hypothetical protein
LLRLSNIADVHIAIISGRSLGDVKEMVGIDGLTYAGNHGLEILHPDGTKFVHPVPQGHEDQLNLIKSELQEQACRDGAWIEPKGMASNDSKNHDLILRIREWFISRPFCDNSEPSFSVFSLVLKLNKKKLRRFFFSFSFPLYEAK